MKKVIYQDTTQRIPIKMWLDDIDDNAMQQAYSLSQLPFAFKHIALMPDCHLGHGMPIGGVMATEGVIVPNAVGTDIGCGMSAHKTDITAYTLQDKDLKNILRGIRHQIPIGFSHHKHPQEWDGFDNAPYLEVVIEQIDNARYQIGTLGGGNHFIEIQKDENNQVWIMLHSGSRNLGFRIANYYHKLAKNLCGKWYSDIPTDQLSFLPMDSDAGRGYKEAMEFALNFAHANRRRMMKRIEEILYNVRGISFVGEQYNIHHNYASVENHFGKNVLVHRKGATSARKGEIGIIPGSQGTKSYIVEGLGNPDSFHSCSHGAGRIMSRKEAIDSLDIEEEKMRLDAKGIIHSIRTKNDLDEAPSAYKDISIVIKNQEDLVKIVTELRPIAVIKG
jgi:tRNA-splicing ligase RtcB